jgi:Na+/H+ antiporter NhaD/arsenite permease-like protein
MFIVGGLEKTGILNNLSTWLIQVAGGSPSNAAIMILWFSGIASTMVSNVAIALTFLPIITSQTISGLNSPAVWSALVLGTNLGGATTPFSGSVCMMAIGTLKREGISVGFTDFARVGLMTTILQLGFSSLFLFVRFGMIGL